MCFFEYLLNLGQILIFIPISLNQTECKCNFFLTFEVIKTKYEMSNGSQHEWLRI